MREGSGGFFNREVAKIRSYGVGKSCCPKPRCATMDSPLKHLLLQTSPRKHPSLPAENLAAWLRRARIVLLMTTASLMLSGCAIYTVADAAVSVVATGVKVTAKVVGAAVDAVTPGDDDSDEAKKKK